MADRTFFDEQTEQSFVKSEIVAKYFDAWAKVMIASQDRYRSEEPDKRIAYIDLFAGPGRYKNGSASTPVKILEKAISNPVYQERLVCLFNDRDDNNTTALANAIKEIPGIQNIKHAPQINNQEVGTEIVAMFESMHLVPTLFFVDPWGYKGLSLRLINSVLKDWGCDCIFFFNYNRINMGMRNPLVKEHIDSLFGEERADQIRRKLDSIDTPQKREICIIENLCAALKELGGKYTLPFRFKNADGTRTSHHLIFVSKHFKGYEIMKDIMAKESSSHDDGVPSFEYNSVDEYGIRQGLLFKLSRPIEDLADNLLNCFAGQSLYMNDIYMQHSVDTPYIKKNYKDALLQLEHDGKITATQHRANSFADTVIATFPER